MENPQNHDQLRQAYLEDLRWARGEAMDMWKNDLKNLIEEHGGDEARAREIIAERKPPSANRKVIGVIRNYWLACVRLNDSLPAERRVSPLVFIYDSLATDAPDLHAFLSTIPYWPMGQDENGRWI
jgi:hypothetical protein